MSTEGVLIRVEFERALRAAFRQGSALTFGANIMPVPGDDVMWPSTLATKAAPYKQWLIERDSFEESVVSDYLKMQIGEVRMLIAGTGVGKTTKLPYSLTAAHQVNGLVIMPRPDMVSGVLSYLRNSSGYQGVTFESLKPCHLTQPEQGLVVYYSAAPDFLSLLSTESTLLSLLSVHYLYLDEAHEIRPDYYWVRLLVAKNVFGNVRVFYGTATGAGDVRMESGGAGREVVSKPLDMFPMTNPNSVKSNSPLHHSQIIDNTVLFCANDEEAFKWEQYYNDRDIPTTRYLYGSSRVDLQTATKTLNESGVCVFLTNSLCETCLTANLTTVLDSGYTTALKYDMANAKVILEKRTVTYNSRTQRAGRVGRFKKGRVFFADTPVSPVESELAPENTIYIYLWSVVFNIKVRNPDIAAWEDALGPMTKKRASILLHARMPPFLLAPFVGPDGFFKGWGRSMANVLWQPAVYESDISNADAVQKWPVHNTGGQPYITSPGKYKCRVQPPSEWACFFYHAWKSYSGSSAGLADFTYDTQSVGSLAVRKLPIREIYEKKRDKSRAIETIDERSESTSRPVSANVAMARELLDRATTVRTKYKSVDYSDFDKAVDDNEPYRDAVKLSNEVPSLRAESKRRLVDNWVEDSVKSVKPVKHGRRYSGVTVSSSSEHSDDRNVIELKQVDPKKYAMHKFYPMDFEARDVFFSNQALTNRDYERVHSLVSGKKVFDSLERKHQDRASMQQKYFLSIVKTHNHVLTKLLQISVSETRSFIDRVVKRDDVKTLQEQLDKTIGLLTVCEMDCFYVGVDKRSLHGVTPDSATSNFSLGMFEHDQLTAQTSLILGDPIVQEWTDKFRDVFLPIFDEDLFVGHAWVVEGKIYSVAHLFYEDDTQFRVLEDAIQELDRTAEDLIVFSTNTMRSVHPVIKSPTDRMNVYVMAFDAVAGELKAHGPFVLISVGRFWVITKSFDFGYSGALIYSIDNANVVGLYVGYYDTLDDTMYGRVAPLNCV